MSSTIAFTTLFYPQSGGMVNSFDRRLQQKTNGLRLTGETFGRFGTNDFKSSPGYTKQEQTIGRNYLTNVITCLVR